MNEIIYRISRNKVLILAVLSAVLVEVQTGEGIVAILVAVVGLLQRQLAVPVEEVIELPEAVELDPIDIDAVSTTVLEPADIGDIEARLRSQPGFRVR